MPNAKTIITAMHTLTVTSVLIRLLAVGGHVLTQDRSTSYGVKMVTPDQLMSSYDRIFSLGRTLSKNGYAHFLKLLFTDFDKYSTEEIITHLFETFDSNCDGEISSSEFQKMWTERVQIILCPKFAFLIIDVQNDFIDGTLSVRNVSDNRRPECIVPVINNITRGLPWDLVVYTQDWHPESHISFYENKHSRKLVVDNKVNPDATKVFDTVRFIDNTSDSGVMEQTLWPQHCVQDTWGADLHKDLEVIEGSILIRKGMDPNVYSYSAFWDNDRRQQTALHAELQKRSITDVIVCGIAYDVCVKSTAMHAMELGYRTTIVDDASCGTSSANTKTAKTLLGEMYCMFLKSMEIKNLVSGEERPLYLGLQHAQAIAERTRSRKTRT